MTEPKAPSNNYSSPRWSGELHDCSVPMTFDAYNKCSYNCLYCFAFFQKTHCLGGTSKKQSSRTRQFQSDVPLVHVNEARVRAIFAGGPSEFQAFVLARKTVQWGGLADPFDENERRLGVGLRMLQMFADLDQPLTFSTKGVFWTKDERYTSIIRGRKNWHAKFSIINYDPGLAMKIEKGCPSPAQRIEAMREFAELDAGWPILRLRPFIIGLTDRRGELEALIHDSAAAGARSVSMEFMCLESRADVRIKRRYEEMSRVLGFDIYDFYRRHTRPPSGYMRLNYALKRPYLERVQRACEREGLRLYISDAHFKELSPSCVCCGLPDSAPVYHGNFSEALQVAKRVGRVRWSDIAEEAERFIGSVEFNRSTGYNKGSSLMRVRKRGHSLLDIVKSYWNNPNAARSPYKMFGGVLLPDGIDERGDVIYRWNPTREIVGAGPQDPPVGPGAPPAADAKAGPVGRNTP